MSIPKDDPVRSPVPAEALRVAVLEDDAALRDDILIPGLREYGFEVSGAESAAEFYRHMLGRKLDMVVVDIGLPDDSGLNVARHLRATFPSLGIVMLTANRGRDDNIRAMTDGADVYLRKPVDVEVLAATLHSLARRMAVYESQGVVSQAGRWHLDANGWCLVAPTRGVLALTAQE
ncbi:MAG: response regulator, partial [Pseudoxanthomonas sp.]